jgi:hypothetical protein
MQLPGELMSLSVLAALVISEVDRIWGNIPQLFFPEDLKRADDPPNDKSSKTSVELGRKESVCLPYPPQGQVDRKVEAHVDLQHLLLPPFNERSALFWQGRVAIGNLGFPLLNQRRS